MLFSFSSATVGRSTADKMSGASSRGAVSPQEQREIDLQLQQVLKRSVNASCADCGAKHPRWASVNIGRFGRDE